ncbi:hypothetical protein ACEPPZ_15505, partial [Paracoccus yeei]
HADRFTQSARAALERTGAQVMLTEGIARAYREGQARFEARNAFPRCSRLTSALSGRARETLPGPRATRWRR